MKFNRILLRFNKFIQAEGGIDRYRAKFSDFTDDFLDFLKVNTVFLDKAYFRSPASNWLRETASVQSRVFYTFKEILGDIILLKNNIVNIDYAFRDPTDVLRLRLRIYWDLNGSYPTRIEVKDRSGHYIYFHFTSNYYDPECFDNDRARYLGIYQLHDVTLHVYGIEGRKRSYVEM